VIINSLSLDLFAVLFGGATALLPVFAAEIYHCGAQGLGVLRSAPAAGAVLNGCSIDVETTGKRSRQNFIGFCSDVWIEHDCICLEPRIFIYQWLFWL
jgi:hypothetical protein